MTKEEELQNSLSKTIDYYENYISELNRQSVMVYAAARNYEDKCRLLQDQLALTEKALELTVETMRYGLSRVTIKHLYSVAMKNLKDNLNRKVDTWIVEWFKEQAKEMMKSE